MKAFPVELKTGLWLDALMRRAQSAGAFAHLARRGDPDSGSVLVLVRAQAGLTLYAAERDMTGVRLWRPTATDEDASAQLIANRADFDPDLNVVEIEDRDGRHFIEEPVMGSEATQADEAAAVAAAKALFRDR